jgi:hypothetical protein
MSFPPLQRSSNVVDIGHLMMTIMMKERRQGRPAYLPACLPACLPADGCVEISLAARGLAAESRCICLLAPKLDNLAQWHYCAGGLYCKLSILSM